MACRVNWQYREPKSLSAASADLSMQRLLAPKLAHPGKNAAPLVAFNAAALGGVAYRAIVRSKRRSTHHSKIVAVWLPRKMSGILRLIGSVAFW